MQIEVGKTYNLNNGDTVTINSMKGVDPYSVDEYGYGPFYSNGLGLFHIDGRFSDGNCPNLDIISECVEEEVGTLAELGVKDGDVVECLAWAEGGKYHGHKQHYVREGASGQAAYQTDCPTISGTYFPIYSEAKFRIISRADDTFKGDYSFLASGGSGLPDGDSPYLFGDGEPTRPSTPKTWGEMSDAEKGALLLARNEGKVIEWIDVDCPTDVWEVCPKLCLWEGKFKGNGFAYRIKPEPKRETVEFMYPLDTHRITFDTIDGEPDCGSVKMEAV